MTGDPPAAPNPFSDGRWTGNKRLSRGRLMSCARYTSPIPPAPRPASAAQEYPWRPGSAADARRGLEAERRRRRRRSQTRAAGRVGEPRGRTGFPCAKTTRSWRSTADARSTQGRPHFLVRIVVAAFVLTVAEELVYPLVGLESALIVLSKTSPRPFTLLGVGVSVSDVPSSSRQSRSSPSQYTSRPRGSPPP